MLLAAAVLFIIGRYGITRIDVFKILTSYSVFCAAAKEIGLMLAGRVIQGIGAGGQLGLVGRRALKLTIK